MKKIIYFVSVLLVGCSAEPIESLDLQNTSLEGSAVAQQGNPHNQFETPSVEQGTFTEHSLEVIITAGESGATGGLSVRWMTLEDYETYGWNNGQGGHVLLNGKADPSYSLIAGEKFSFLLEDYITGEGDSWNRALECGQSYVFIIQAHQDGSTQKSDYSDPVVVSTASCEVNEPCPLDTTVGTIEQCANGINNPDLRGFNTFFRAQVLNHTDLNGFTGTFDPTIQTLVDQYYAEGPVGTYTTYYTEETEECGVVTTEVSVTVTDC